MYCMATTRPTCEKYYIRKIQCAKAKLALNIKLTSTNVLWVRKCSAYNEPMTSHAFGEIAGSRHMQQRADVMAAVLQVWRHIRNPTPLIDAFNWRTILPNFTFQPGPISNDGALGLFEERRPCNKTTRQDEKRCDPKISASVDRKTPSCLNRLV